MNKLTLGTLALLLAGCATSVPVKMYPVQGPLAKQAPPPVVVATAGQVNTNSGPITFTLPNGSPCEGTWSSVAPKFATANCGTLFSAYGAATGFGSSVGILPGANKGQLYAVCSDNTRVDGEFVTGSGTANGYGIAKDTRGNVYKLLF